MRRWWRYTKHHHAHPGMVLKLGARGHAKHQKHVQMGIVSRFGRWGGGGDTPNIETCASEHGFDVRLVKM